MEGGDHLGRCGGCGLERGSPSCEVTEIEIHCRRYERIRYVPRGEWDGGVYRHRCRGCGIWPANVHHIGCEIEMCPACEGQLVSCGCEYGYRRAGLSGLPRLRW